MYDTVVIITWNDYGVITHSIGWLLNAEDRCLRLALEYTDSGPIAMKIPVGDVIDLKLV